MTGSSQPEWQRSSIGITPLTVRPRAGSRRVKKFDVVGTGTAQAEKQASNGAQVNIIFPGIGDRGGEEGVEGGGSSGSRQAAAGRVCSVCTRASADYSCPRCLIGYCSSKCYKTHGSGCTEAFFRGHVERETRLREGEDGRGGGKEGRRASMTELLRRIRLDGKTCETNGEEESTIVGSSLGEDEFPTTPPPTTTSTSVRGIRGGQQYQQEDEQEEGDEGEGGGREQEKELALQKRLEALALSIEQREQREQRDRRALPAGPALPDPNNASTAVAVAAADASDRGDGGGGNGGGSNGGGGTSSGGGLVVVKKSGGGEGGQKVKKSRQKPAGGKEKRAGQPRVGEPRRGGSTKLGRRTLREPVLGAPALGGPALGDEGALDLLTEEENARFLRELASGRLGKLIVPWEPWWEQSGGVQEVVTGRTTHSLPPAVVAPCFVVKTFAGGGGAPGSCSLTQPPTPEEESEEKQQKQQQQPQLKRRQKQPVLDLTGNGGGGGGDGGDGGGGGVSVIAAVASAVAHSGEQRGALEEENGRENEKDKEWRETKEKEGMEKGRGGGEEKEGDKPQEQQQEQEQEEEEECTRHSFASLQNQACMAPDFSTLCAMKPSPALPSLAADLAYAYVLAARLYNGCWCSDPVGASLAFVAASPVLKDRATPATVGQALARCVERAVEGEGAGFRGYAESLRQDVLLVCSDPRKLTCAFQDAWGMFEAAGRTLAPSNPARPVHAKKGQRRAARELGKVEKRVGYFLLWARSHGAQAAPAMAEAVRRSLESD